MVYAKLIPITHPGYTTPAKWGWLWTCRTLYGTSTHARWPRGQISSRIPWHLIKRGLPGGVFFPLRPTNITYIVSVSSWNHASWPIRHHGAWHQSTHPNERFAYSLICEKRNRKGLLVCSRWKTSSICDVCKIIVGQAVLPHHTPKFLALFLRQIY